MALALPFLWAGVVLTLRRLRSAGLPLGLVLLFFVPVLKFFLFAALMILPEAGTERSADESETRGSLGRLIPRQRGARAAVSIGVTLIYSFCATWIGTKYFKSYGWTLFV